MVPARYRGGVVLAAVFVAAWLVALVLSSADRARTAQSPTRWVQGPAPFAEAASAPAPATGTPSSEEGSSDDDE